MFIEQDKYQRLPFAIQTGSLLLWGTRLGAYENNNCLHELYLFNDFYVELRYNENQQPVSIQTFLTSQALEPFLKSIETGSLPIQ